MSSEAIPLDPNHRKRLVRFLHTGLEVPKYYPGCWSAHKYFEVNSLPVVDEIYLANEKNVEAVSIIVEAFKSNMYTRYETIAFALSKVQLKGNQDVKAAAYKAVQEICQTPEQLMLLNKYTRMLKTGNGQGWKKSIVNWYNSKTPIELAKEVTRVHSQHGRSHKMLIKKSHLKVDVNDHARAAVVQYVLFGLKKSKLAYDTKEGTQEIFAYIQNIEDFRHCEAPDKAAKLVREHKFTLEYLPGHLLVSQPVWNAVIPQLSLKKALENIQRLHNMAYLNEDSKTTNILLSVLNKKQIKNSDVTPLEMYLVIEAYRMKWRPMKHAKAKVAKEKQDRRRNKQVENSSGGFNWTVKQKHPREIKYWGIDSPPNDTVLAALNNLFVDDCMWLTTKPTGARYFVTLDMRQHMFQGRHFCKKYTTSKKAKPPAEASTSTFKVEDVVAAETKPKKKRQLAECFYYNCVQPGHVAAVIALQLLKREENVTIAVFTENGIQIVPFNKKATKLEQLENKLMEQDLGRVQLDAPIQYAIQENLSYDVFINIVDRTTRYMELDKQLRGGRGPGGRFGPPPAADKDLVDHCPVRALYRYKQIVPKAKMITMSLASHRVATTDGSHADVLDIVGVDKDVQKVMDAFVMDLFQ